MKTSIILLSMCICVPTLFAEPYSFNLIKKRDVSYGATKRMVYSIYLDTESTPSEERMKETAQQIWKNGNQRWNEFTVWMIFGPIKNFDTGAYGIAEFTPSGLKEFQINDIPLQMLELESKSPPSRKSSEEKFFDPQKLRIGQVFFVSKQTPLMPELNPSDPLKAAQRMKQIPIGGAFKIEEVQKRGTTPWYRVVAIDKDHKKIGNGWINSIALLGQNLQEIK